MVQKGNLVSPYLCTVASPMEEGNQMEAHSLLLREFLKISYVPSNIHLIGHNHI